jgi:AcrR family transcriptional regulator
MSTKSTKIKTSLGTVRERQTNRAEQKLETRRRILDAAILVFGRDGILKATTSDIAKEAGVAHGSVFVHFGSQEALVAAAIEDFGETMTRRLHETMRRGAGTREVLASHLAGIREREDFYARLAAESSLLSAEERNGLVLMQSAIAFHLVPAVEADRKAKRIKTMSLPLLFNTWLGLVHYYLANRELFAPGESVIDARGRELLDHFMAMIEK